jgi:hypothetical protein
MRRLIMVLPLVLLVMAPTGVQAAADDLVVCDTPPEGTIVVGANASLTPPVASPLYDLIEYTWTDLNYQLDLYPATATNRATVASTLNWTLDVNDWDLHLIDGDGMELKSEGAQLGPVGDPPTEYVQTTLKHCSLFTIRVYNYSAPISGEAGDELDPLQLGITSGPVK